MTRFSINTPMLTRYFWRLYENKRYEEMCEREWIISPACTSLSPPAIRLPGQIERVTGYTDSTSIEFERVRINGGHREHAPTIARVLRNAEICDGYIYKRGAKIPISVGPERFLLRNHSDEVKDSAAITCSFNDSKYFGHWVTDGIPLLMAGGLLAPPIRNSQQLTPHQKEYLSILDLSYDGFTDGRVRELIIMEDYSQNRYKRERYEIIRARFLQSGYSSTHPGVIILRGGSGTTPRYLIKEKEIAAYLQSIGYKVVDPERQSAGEIIEAISGASVVVGIEGSQLAHGLFSMAPSGTLLVLQPPYLFNNVHKDYTDCLDLNYAFVVGDACEGGFSISMDDLKKTLDLISFV